MSQFSTEFLVAKTFSTAQFTAQVLAWLRGMEHGCRLFDDISPSDLSGDDIELSDGDSERLHLHAFGRDKDWVATGCRHDVVAPQRRLWRTEAVLRALPGRGNLLRVRAQCLAVDTLVRLEVPKRTHLIRMILEDGQVAADGHITPSTTPHMLPENEEAVTLAERIVQGGASQYLPIVYVSATGDGQWALDRRALKDLALRLAGVAHVVCEPSRDFSFALRDRIDGGNVYNGTIGLAAPGSGFVHRAYLGWANPDAAALGQKVLTVATTLRSQMPSVGGWDWLDLQDAILKRQIDADRKRLTAEENENLWREELDLKEARILDLEAELRDLRGNRSIDPPSGGSIPSLLTTLKPEIYNGEFADRIRAALEFCLEKGGDSGWDKRSLAVFEEFLATTSMSQELEELRQDLSRATRDASRLNAELRRLLARHGFVHKSDNKHSRMEPDPDYPGLDSVTLMKTPGDRRGLDNLCSKIEGNLGLTRLKQVRR